MAGTGISFHTVGVKHSVDSVGPLWVSSGFRLFLLVGLALVVYAAVFHAGFIWDDDAHITRNIPIQTDDGLARIWTEPGATPQYYPLTFTLFWMQHRLWGMDPLGYHLVNLMLHLLNACLLGWLMVRLRIPGAWWAACLFAVHPVHVMSVAWVTELKNVLSLALGLGSIHAWISARSASHHRLAWLWWPCALAFFIAAIAAKTASVYVPAGMLALLAWSRTPLRSRAWIFPLLLLGLGGAAASFTLHFETVVVGASGPEYQLAFLERMLLSARAFWFYVGKLLMPVHLSFIYPRWEIPLPLWNVVYLVALVLLLLLLLRSRVSWRYSLGVAVLYYFAAGPSLLMAKIIYMMRYTFVSDHWIYFSSPAFCMVAGAALVRIASPERSPFVRWLPALLIGALAVAGYQRTQIFESSQSIYEDTLRKNPASWMAHNNYGLVLKDQGRSVEAEGHFRESIQLRPDNAKAWNNLGLVLKAQHRLTEAEQAFRSAVDIDLHFSEARSNLGLLLVEQGSVEEGMAQLQEAIRLWPESPHGYNQLGLAQIRLGDKNTATGTFLRGLEQNPYAIELISNLASMLMDGGRLDEALLQYNQAVKLQPDQPYLRYNLARACRAAGLNQAAIDSFRQAIRLDRQWAQPYADLGALFLQQKQIPAALDVFQEAAARGVASAALFSNYGTALAMAGRLDQAEQVLMRALALDPSHQDARNNLAALRAMIGGPEVRTQTTIDTPGIP